jgi:hypothetical protein
MDYQGWTLFDKVLIVAKKLGHWDYQEAKYVEDDDWQGYIVDPANKKMKENALRWAETCRTKYDENGNYCGYDRTPGEEFLYDNDGFRLELLETAGGSSQGGKLSFWNCWVTAPDGKRFKVGIAADLLLELLLQTVFDRGTCTSPLCFARCKGGVGMLDKDSESYQQALSDMQKKADVKNKKTSKHKIGYAYSALQQVNGYVADLYVWYEPIIETYKPNHWSSYTYERVVGFKKLEKPKKFFWFPDLYHFEPGTIYKTSSCVSNPTAKPYAWVPGRLFIRYHDLKEKLPARIEVGECIEYDLPLEDVIAEYNQREIIKEIEEALAKAERTIADNKCYPLSTLDLIGLSVNPDSYELPEDVRAAILSTDLRIED